VLKSEFMVEAIIIFVKNIKKHFKWYIHFIGKPVIWTAIILPFQRLDPMKERFWTKIKVIFARLCLDVKLITISVVKSLKNSVSLPWNLIFSLT